MFNFIKHNDVTLIRLIKCTSLLLMLSKSQLVEFSLSLSLCRVFEMNKMYIIELHYCSCAVIWVNMREVESDDGDDA